MKVYYTIEKLPIRKSWSLNRKDVKSNTLTPIAYFTSEEYAKLALKELSSDISYPNATKALQAIEEEIEKIQVFEKAYKGESH